METRSDINAVFQAAAPKYDRMNDLLSLFIHRLWKRRFVRGIRFPKHASVLDLSAGSGDISRLILKKPADVSIALVDPSPAMLNLARRKIDGKKALFKQGSAENIPFPDGTFDSVVCSFGVRNFSDRAQGLSEIFRVLKPKGRFYCLEFSTPPFTPFRVLYDLYTAVFFPFWCRIAQSPSEPYRYLAQSIREFPHPPEFSESLEKAGFKNVSFQRLTFGIAAIHQGVKP